jgi:bacterioferritin-associated ferredoxin
MYICLCNGFTDGKVRMVARRGECSVAEVYRALGCKPQCGKCVPLVRDLIRETADSRMAASSEVVGAPRSLLLAGADC